MHGMSPLGSFLFRGTVARAVVRGATRSREEPPHAYERESARESAREMYTCAYVHPLHAIDGIKNFSTEGLATEVFYLVKKMGRAAS